MPVGDGETTSRDSLPDVANSTLSRGPPATHEAPSAMIVVVRIESH
jgi:hypothetical protein